MEDCVLVRSCLQDLNKPLPDDQDAQIEKRKKSFVCKLFFQYGNDFSAYFSSVWNDIKEYVNFEWIKNL